MFTEENWASYTIYVLKLAQNIKYVLYLPTGWDHNANHNHSAEKHSGHQTVNDFQLNLLSPTAQLKVVYSKNTALQQYV